MSSRRDFLRRLALLTAGTGVLGAVPVFGRESRGSRTLTILHTNDTHARLDPFPASGGALAGLGGIARRATLVNQVRAEAEAVVLLDAGDVFQGTPYFNFYSAEPDLKAMTAMGYDAWTLGNHEFDNRVGGLLQALPHAGFPLVNSNYEVSGSPLADHIKPYHVVQKGDFRIGIVGAGIDFPGLVLASHHEGVAYRDPIRWVRYWSDRVRYFERCDYVICLSHLGFRYQSDRVDDCKLAQACDGVDLVIGGHTHTFLEVPERFTHANGRETLVTQVGHGGVVLGRIDVRFDHRNRVEGAMARNQIVGEADWGLLTA